MTKRRVIRRAVWCLVLGQVTTWVVAWGIQVALWGDVISARFETTAAGFAFVDDQFVSYEAWSGHGFTIDFWQTARFREDRTQDPNSWEARVTAIGRDEYLDRQFSYVPHPSISRVDARAASFRDSPLRQFVRDMPLYDMLHLRVGWPAPCVSEALICESSGPKGENQGPDRSFIAWTIMISQLDRGWKSGLPGGGELRLPYRPIWRGLMVDTAFYAALWALPLLGLPLLKQRFRVRRGHCPACGYDLKGEFANGCPECGKAWAGRSGSRHR